MKQAVYFLHDLGTLQYFDNDLLRDKVIINPQWIVDVMSCLVSANNKYCQVNFDITMFHFFRYYHVSFLLDAVLIFLVTFTSSGSSLGNISILPCFISIRCCVNIFGHLYLQDLVLGIFF